MKLNLNVKKGLQGLLRPIEQLFLPSYCYACGSAKDGTKFLHSVCENCWNALTVSYGSICSRCGKHLVSEEPGKTWHDYKCADCRADKRIPYSFMRSLLPYKSPLREMIHLFKFEGMINIGEELGKILGESVKAHSLLFRNHEIVVPVPLHKWRILQRGFNQSSILAQFVATSLNIPIEEQSLVRTRNTPSQSRMQRDERKSNLKGAFKADTVLVKGKKVLLIDDVTTTESTIRECARVLKRAGAAEVAALTLSRTENT